MLRSTWSAMIYSYSSDFFAFSLSFSEMSNFLLFFLYSSTQNTDAARCNVWPKEEGVWQTLLDFSLLSLSLFDWLKPFPFLVVRNASNFGTCERTRFSSHSRDNHVKVAFYSWNRIFNWNWKACQLGEANFRPKIEVQTHYCKFFTDKFLSAYTVGSLYNALLFMALFHGKQACRFFWNSLYKALFAKIQAIYS